jgi:hypothetical protein
MLCQFPIPFVIIRDNFTPLRTAFVLQAFLLLIKLYYASISSENKSFKSYVI